jgi:hypothetical protein
MTTITDTRPRRSRVLTTATTSRVAAKITPRLLLPDTVMLGLAGGRDRPSVGSDPPAAASPSTGMSGNVLLAGATRTARSPGNG